MQSKLAQILEAPYPSKSHYRSMPYRPDEETVKLREKRDDGNVGVLTLDCVGDITVDQDVSGESVVSREDAVKKTRSGNVYLIEENRKKDSVGTYWMSIDRNKCFDEEITVLVVEIPKNDHHLPEVVEAKAKDWKIWTCMELWKKLRMKDKIRK